MRKVLALSLVLFAATIVVPLFGAVPAAAAPPYSIKILSPATMAQVSTLGVQIRVQVGSGFILDQQNWGGVNITDHGHIHYFVDGAIKANTWLTQVTLTGLTPGPHVLRAELRNNDHSPVAPVVADSVTVTAGTPSIKILEPTKDESVSSLGFRVRVAVSNFTMSTVDFGGWNVSGEGHMHILEVVGGVPMYKTATAATLYTVTGWTAGVHTLKVQLYNNNHSALSTEYSDSVTFKVETPSITLTAPASVVQGQDVTITWSVKGFVLDAGAFGGWNETGRGHVHIFEVVNGVENYKDATAGSSYTFSDLSPGTHTFKVELYNNNHTELPTEYSSTKTVTVTAAGSPLEAGAFSPTVFYGSVVALVIVIVALAAMLVRKGRGGKPAPPPQM